MLFLVKVYKSNGNLLLDSLTKSSLIMYAEREKSCVVVTLKKQIEDDNLMKFVIKCNTEFCALGGLLFSIQVEDESVILEFENCDDMKKFREVLNKIKCSAFCKRTDNSSANSYFSFYSLLQHQQNMLEDHFRTSTYYDAIMCNCLDFQDKIVLDVGAGSGILSFFAVQAGAERVYAVEASEMARHAKTLVTDNKLEHKICVMEGLMEEIELPELVDVIISEPIGYMLFNERMWETFLYAKKWLKTGGKIFPSRGNLYIAPFYDNLLFLETSGRACFWESSNFYGTNLSSLKTEARKQYFRQPVIDTFNIDICLAKPVVHTIDFYKTNETDLLHMEIPLEFLLEKNGVVNGLAFWFDIFFEGTYRTVQLSTSPTVPPTHWYQTRCLIDPPLHACCGKTLKGKVIFDANKQQSYYVRVELFIEGNDQVSSNLLDLKNPFFRYAFGSSSSYNATGIHVEDVSPPERPANRNNTLVLITPESSSGDLRCSDLNAQKST